MNLTNNKYSDGFFNVSIRDGFLPIKEPLKSPPKKYNSLNDIIENLPSILEIDNEIEKRVEMLENYIDLVNYEDDVFILSSLYRSYSFLTSAYLLEPAHKNMVDGMYGKPKNKLPKNISEPFECVARKLDVFPFLDYHYAYSLGNYIKKDKSKGLEYSNLEMAVSFSGTKDETGFIMLHVDINRFSKDLIKSIDLFNQGRVKESLTTNLEAMKQINSRRMQMWKASNSKNYNNFRCYIMGIKDNDMFGEGVFYGDDPVPRQYRGQTGAQDDIIPTEDIFIGIINYYPKNRLTKYLLDLRQYRPKCIQKFHNDLFSTRINMLESLKVNDYYLILLLQIVEQVYKFRHGHWMFAQKYIMANTKHPVSTGGTPIISWLPNQILSVLNYMEDILDEIKEHTEISKRIEKDYERYRDIIEKQIKDMNVKIEVTKLYKDSLSIQLEDEDIF
jgi:indoleamine 2,3-dioxygenase